MSNGAKLATTMLRFTGFSLFGSMIIVPVTVKSCNAHWHK